MLACNVSTNKYFRRETHILRLALWAYFYVIFRGTFSTGFHSTSFHILASTSLFIQSVVHRKRTENILLNKRSSWENRNETVFPIHTFCRNKPVKLALNREHIISNISNIMSEWWSPQKDASQRKRTNSARVRFPQCTSFFSYRACSLFEAQKHERKRFSILTLHKHLTAFETETNLLQPILPPEYFVLKRSWPTR